MLIGALANGVPGLGPEIATGPFLLLLRKKGPQG
jgi:hypothetical protein